MDNKYVEGQSMNKRQRLGKARARKG